MGVMTEAKNASIGKFSAPSATPVVLLKDLMRPLTATTNCDGPTVPMVSGGNEPVSASVAPVKLVETVCDFGCEAADEREFAEGANFGLPSVPACGMPSRSGRNSGFNKRNAGTPDASRCRCN